MPSITGSSLRWALVEEGSVVMEPRSIPTAAGITDGSSLQDKLRFMKGRTIGVLRTGAKQQFYPELWDIRSSMTDEWGCACGVKRDPIHKSAETDG